MRKLGAVTVFYFLLAGLALYWPLFNIQTHLTGTAYAPTTDYYHFHWNYWWMRHALATGQSIYETNYVMAPFTSSLAYHTLTPFWYPLWAVIEPLFGTVAGMTAIFLASMTLVGLLFYALLRREGVATGLALVGGAMLAVSPMMFNGIFWTNINLMGWFWLPALFLLWGQIVQDVEKRRTRQAAAWVLVLGIALWAMILTDIQYPLFAAFLIVPYGLYTLVTRRWPQLILSGIVAVSIALVLLWVAGPLPHILNYDRSGLSPTPAERTVSIPFPEGYIWHVDDGTAPVSMGAVVLPLLAIALFLSLRRHHTCNRHWFWLALVPLPLILSAGASITVFGAGISLPYQLLHDLFGGMFRYPERFAPVILIPAMIFAMQVLTPLVTASRARHTLTTTALLLLVIADSRMLQPFPIQPIPHSPDFYSVMAQEPYDYVVIEAPTGASSGEGIVGEALYSALQYHGTIHGKRMINGHFSRVNIQHYWYLRTDDPLLSWLGQRIYLEPERAEARLREIMEDFPVGYIVVHTDLIERFTGITTVGEVIGYLNSLPDLLCPVYVEGPAVAYRTVWHPDGCPARTPPEVALGVYEIDLGTQSDQRFIGWGWYWAEEIVPGLNVRWTGTQPAAQIYFDLPKPGSYELNLSAQSFAEPRTLQVSLNDTEIGVIEISPDSLNDYAITIPANAIGDSQQLTLTLEYDSPSPVGDGSREIAIMVDAIRFIRTP